MASPGFDIDLVFTSSISAEQQAAFTEAGQRWEEVITGDIGRSVIIPRGRSFCGQPPRRQNLRIDDLLIFVSVSDIDGPGRVLGRAGPCGFDRAGRPRVGSMQFDLADVQALEASGRLVSTIMHEMGHVLGKFCEF